MTGVSALPCGFSKNRKLETAPSVRARTLARSEAPFMQGPTARQFVVVESGRVHLTQLNPNGNQLILRRAGPVNPFGASTG